MNLYLIRHGESMGNKAGKIQGTTEFPLSPLGEKQAIELGKYFHSIPLDYIYSSSLTRAKKTAEKIAEHKGIQVEESPLVREVHLGPFQGKTRKEIHEQFPETLEKTILTSGVEGTETIEELTNRCRALKEEIILKHDGENVAIVSHGGFISIFLMYFLIGDQWHTLHRPFKIDNTSITRLEWKDKERPLIHYVGRNNHLSAIKEDSSSMLL